MNIKPILFNTEMVRAILDGRKTVTRRLVKPRYVLDADNNPHFFSRAEGNLFVWEDRPYIKTAIKQPYLPGDILYVRETWAHPSAAEIANGADPEMYLYKADPLHRAAWDKWRPSIHMPKEAARIFLRVTDVRVERLQNITGDECPSEGVPLYSGPVGGREACYRFCFADIWDDTIKPSDFDDYGWSANPWVWVIKFERCEKPKEALW